MKAVLALQHGVMPRNLHFTRLPDEMAQIEIETLRAAGESRHGPATVTTPRRAAVSSYGFSGTNVHAIVEQAPETAAPGDAPTTPAMAGPLFFPLSATSAEDCGKPLGGSLIGWQTRAGPGAIGSGVHTGSPACAPAGAHGGHCRQPRGADRGFGQVAEGDIPYQAAVGQDDRGPVWLFSGQGSQWAAMGAGLLATEPVFAATVAEVEPLIARESGFSVTKAISAPETVTGIDRIQPTLFTMQVALAATMRSYGVQPGAVIGHSMGEVAAAVVAGALSLEDGVRVICCRSRLMSTHRWFRGDGVGGTACRASAFGTDGSRRDDVVLAVVASPQSTVIGGATQTVRDLVAAWEQRGVLAREIAVDVASHSPQVDPILDELADVLAELDPDDTEVPFYSATLFDPREQPVWDAWYWADNLRHTVRFAAAVQAALEDGYRVFAELAPHPLLTHAVEQTAGSLDMPLAALAAMRREQELPHGLRGFLADLHSAGAAVDFSVLYPGGQLVDAPLPTWTHRRCCLTRSGQDSRARGACTSSGAPADGGACAIARGAGAPRLAG